MATYGAKSKILIIFFFKFVMLMDNNQIFRNCFVIIYCHLTKVSSQINSKCTIFGPNELSITLLFYGGSCPECGSWCGKEAVALSAAAVQEGGSRPECGSWCGKEAVAPNAAAGAEGDSRPECSSL